MYTHTLRYTQEDTTEQSEWGIVRAAASHFSEGSPCIDTWTDRTQSLWRKLIPGRRPNKSWGPRSRSTGVRIHTGWKQEMVTKRHNQGCLRSSRVIQPRGWSIFHFVEKARPWTRLSGRITWSNVHSWMLTFGVCLLITEHGFRSDRACGAAQLPWLATLLHCLRQASFSCSTLHLRAPDGTWVCNPGSYSCCFSPHNGRALWKHKLKLLLSSPTPWCTGSPQT